jgi:leucyl-tRNA synthetase
MLVAETVVYAVQVNGKLRGQVEVALDAGKDSVLAAARAVPNVAAHLDGASVVKEIVVPGRLVNLVVREG